MCGREGESEEEGEEGEWERPEAGMQQGFDLRVGGRGDDACMGAGAEADMGAGGAALQGGQGKRGTPKTGRSRVPVSLSEGGHCCRTRGHELIQMLLKPRGSQRCKPIVRVRMRCCWARDVLIHRGGGGCGAHSPRPNHPLTQNKKNFPLGKMKFGRESQKSEAHFGYTNFFFALIPPPPVP